MNEKEKIKLNIGAGQTYIPNFINIDISEKADISINLGEEKLPFDDDSVDFIFSYHTLEHIPDYLFALSEIYRVLKHGSQFLIGLPYVTLTEYHLVNPYHLHNFNEYSFDFFNPYPKGLKGSAAEQNTISFYKVFHRFHYIGFFKIIPPPFRSWCRRHLFNTVRQIDFGLIAIKKVELRNYQLNHKYKKDLFREFEKCLASRRPYNNTGVISKPKTIRGLAKIIFAGIQRVHQKWLGF